MRRTVPVVVALALAAAGCGSAREQPAADGPATTSTATGSTDTMPPGPIDELPPIVVESPARGDTVRSPFHVTGTSDTYEATFQYELRDADGKVIAKHFVTATTGNGQRGTFDFVVRYKLTGGGPGTLVVYEDSAADGSRIHEREIPLELEP